MKATMMILIIYAILSSTLIVLMYFQIQRLSSAPSLFLTNATPTLGQVQEVAIGNAPSFGPEDAPIVIVEFADFECKVCRDADSAVSRLMAEHPNKIRRVFKHLPLDYHPTALQAASAAMAAHAQGRFWEMYDAFMGMDGPFTTDLILETASSLDINMERFRVEMEPGYWEDYLSEDIRQAMSLGVKGTPTFFVNGAKVEGVGYSKLKKAILELAPE